MNYFCELHNSECILDSEGFGGCGDYNKDGSCLWCLKEGDILKVIK